MSVSSLFDHVSNAASRGNLKAIARLGETGVRDADQAELCIIKLMQTGLIDALNPIHDIARAHIECTRTAIGAMHELACRNPEKVPTVLSRLGEIDSPYASEQIRFLIDFFPKHAKSAMNILSQKDDSHSILQVIHIAGACLGRKDIEGALYGHALANIYAQGPKNMEKNTIIDQSMDTFTRLLKPHFPRHHMRLAVG